MKEIKSHPEDVVDSLKDKKEKNLSVTQNPKYEAVPNGATTGQIEE